MQLLLVLLIVSSAFGVEDSHAIVSAEIQRGYAEDSHSFVGTLYFEERVMAASEVSGVLKETFVQAGTHVQKGAPLAKFDDELLRFELKSKEGLLFEAQAKSLKYGKEFERIEKLYLARTVSLKEYEEARFNRDSALGMLDSLKAQVGRIKAELARKIIYAPFSGVILKKLLNRGEWVNVGASLFNIAKLDPMEARIEVPYEILRQLRIGEEVNVEISGESYRAIIAALIPLGEAKARTFMVKILTNNPKGVFVEGLLARVKLQKKSRIPRY